MAQATNDIADEYPELPAGLTPKELSKHIYVRAKICESCNQKKAITEENFAGESNVCRVCEDLKLQEQSLPTERKALARLLESIDRGHTVPHAADTLSSIMRHMGGPEGVGQKTRFVYDKAVGAQDWKVAARILQTTISMNVKVSQQQQDAAIETMDKDELREYLKLLYSKHIQISLRDPLALPGPDDQAVIDG